MKRILVPKPLRHGATLGVAALSGRLTRPALGAGIAALERRGYGVVRADNLAAFQEGYLCGRDDVRLAGFHALLRDPRVKGVVFARGGYGVMRVLDSLDYRSMRAERKVLAGFSDLTALFCAAYKKAGLASLYSPMILNLATLAREDARRFWCALERQKFFPISFRPGRVISPGRAEGRLIGGCLTLLAHLLGTSYDFSWRGCVLFIEDTGEAPYSTDRLLTHLKLAGKLDGLAGVLIGAEDARRYDKRKSLTFRQVYEDRFSAYRYPVVEGLPFGHGPRKATLPFGGWARLDTAKGRLEMSFRA